MTWVPPIVGYVDAIGVLRCAVCADGQHRQYPVHGDQYFDSDDICDRCGRKLQHVKSSDYVQVSP